MKAKELITILQKIDSETECIFIFDGGAEREIDAVYFYPKDEENNALCILTNKYEFSGDDDNKIN